MTSRILMLVCYKEQPFFLIAYKNRLTILFLGRVNDLYYMESLGCRRIGLPRVYRSSRQLPSFICLLSSLSE